jgi:hypothetical protein
MKKKKQWLSISFMVMLMGGSSLFYSCDSNSPKGESVSQINNDSTKTKQAEPSCEKTEGLKTAMRKLWEDHVTWTRNVILNIMDGLPGADQAVPRLLQNQDDIGNAVKPYYGDDAGNKLTELLHTHITTAADLLKAAKAGNKKAFDDANNMWTVNADSISDFLSKANPNWKLDDMKQMMHDHLKLTTDEATARLKKDYKADIQAYDNVHDEILKMSDMLTAGIIKQFPEKFK